ncbi:c-type cytochrome [Luteolibacter arcticus]|uniref:C-type cytochrome n=1 Tax=Luteolibacter arcticus TaxID=1581411 RepID=A0ABT3GP24_9BACT|nr:PVC-type heme-binding CxxCH protein [Luteolibacter arcticus]MCW1925274.1 c-type cytochrome [Luteolibacter arcticus]
MKAACLSFLPLVASLAAAPESYPCQNGLVRSLVAREPMFINPVAVSVDTDGTIYVTETTRRKQADLDIREVMWWVTDDLSHTSVEERRDFFRRNVTSERFKNHASLTDHDRNGRIDWQDLTVHTEKIHRLVDTDGDGVADQQTLFADGFNTEVTGIAAGVLAHGGDVYATIAPDVWKLRDTDGDGKADQRKAIASGFGVHINYAGHDMHGLTLGPDGRLYWTIGDKGLNVESGGRRWFYPHEGAVLRCNPDGSDFEVFARGLRNVQQIAFDEYGYLFGVDNDSDQKGEKERLVYIPEGSDHGWRCYYQYRGGKYNPWMAERIAFPEGQDRPASIVPPLALYLDGPSGFAYNPGTALNDRYRNHFFLTQFPAGKINAFQLEPDGASFKMKGDHLMASGTAFTGCNFGPDGALYVADWQGGYPMKEKGAVWKIDDPKEAGSAMRKDVATMLKEGPSKVVDDELIKRLGHADQRIRLDAQWELALRKNWDALKKVAASNETSQLARVHALWGLSQSKQFDEAIFITLASGQDPELRSQAAKWAGETIRKLPPTFPALLADASARVRFQAAMAVGKSHDRSQIENVAAMVAANDNKDPFLDHAGSFALRTSTFADLKTFARHPAMPVRLTTVVALGRILDNLWRSNEAANTDPTSEEFCLDEDQIRAWTDMYDLASTFLDDDSPIIVSEAVGILYPTAPQRVAGLLDRKMAPPAPAIRRAIAVNRRIRSEESLVRLARYAADPGHPVAMRILALEALANVDTSEPLDEVTGAFLSSSRIVKPPLLFATDLCQKLDEILSPLTANAQVMQAASSAMDRIGVKRDPAAFIRLALDNSISATRRIDAIRHLKSIGDPNWIATAKSALETISWKGVEVAALLVETDPEFVSRYLRGNVLVPGNTGEDQQQAVRMLAVLPDAKAKLELLLKQMAENKISPHLYLEVLESAEALQLDGAKEVRAALAAKSPDGQWFHVMNGGNPATGKKIFEENLAANCTACHRIGEQGSNVGPPLTKVGTNSRDHLLESLVNPQATVASGYGMMTATKKDGTTLAGTFIEEKDGKLILAQADGSMLEIPLADLASKTAPISTMPPMDAVLKPAELRDLIEFLSTLK